METRSCDSRRLVLVVSSDETFSLCMYNLNIRGESMERNDDWLEVVEKCRWRVKRPLKNFTEKSEQSGILYFKFYAFDRSRSCIYYNHYFSLLYIFESGSCLFLWKLLVITFLNTRIVELKIRFPSFWNNKKNKSHWFTLNRVHPLKIKRKKLWLPFEKCIPSYFSLRSAQHSHDNLLVLLLREHIERV